MNRDDIKKMCDFENQLISDVKLGCFKEIPIPFSFSSLKSAKDYLIGINALLRKAAENSGVSAKLTFEQSKELLNEIHALSTPVIATELVLAITKAYSKLVADSSSLRYSTPVIRAISKIENDLTDDLSLKALAKYNNISAGYFSGLFKKETGLTLTQYINRKRIERAKELLAVSPMKITEISKICGINDTNYFIRLFKAYENLTPKEYRDNLK